MSSIARNSFIFLILMSLLVLWGATITTTATDTTDIGTKHKVLVDISNKLPDQTSFTIHCKSQDDDLGKHDVKAGQKYGFKFRVNWWGTTLFFCGASWQGNYVEFDIYRASRDDEKRCYFHCMWEVRGDAIVGYKEGYKEPDIFIHWKKQTSHILV
ncbi:S-protein homolog 29-like [Punica granatum]|uniref:S-protein homolog n=2 Tax=Punica granatum TaxID=22663 RepID=A0A218XDN0_PUNGR|nr:S-protein homolog 29-like [Punica granatum]OWM82908.1 hypothetical protein CDL15_Pgr005308 [Punica granatum]PKI64252.1 hypothetical protein CRG98_015362 [Punica granatum]